MRHVTQALVFAAALAVCGSAYAQEPASTDGKSVPMEQAPSKIKSGKMKGKHHKTMHRMKKM